MVDAMLTVKESMLILGTVAEADEVAEDVEPVEPDEVAEDEQPAAARARAAAAATQPILGSRRNVPSPPSLLLLTRIPHTLSPECT
jgi:hypothetical protein